MRSRNDLLPPVNPLGDTETDFEVNLAVISMYRFAMGSPEPEHLRKIRHEASLLGARRKGFALRTEEMEKAWNDLVAELRKRIQ